mgnify:CR=1 FL=1
MKNWQKVVNKRIVLFTVGFAGYGGLELLFRGHTFISMCIAGGCIILLLDSLNNRWSYDLDILLQGICGSTMITATELLLGEFIKHTNLLHVMWDYSNMRFNFDGVICLEFSLLWILLSILGILIADALNYYLLGDNERPYYKLFGIKILEFPKKEELLT